MRAKQESRTNTKRRLLSSSPLLASRLSCVSFFSVSGSIQRATSRVCSPSQMDSHTRRKPRSALKLPNFSKRIRTIRPSLKHTDTAHPHSGLRPKINESLVGSLRILPRFPLARVCRPAKARGSGGKTPYPCPRPSSASKQSLLPGGSGSWIEISIRLSYPQMGVFWHPNV